jgi:hypothetical protein
MLRKLPVAAHLGRLFGKPCQRGRQRRLLNRRLAAKIVVTQSWHRIWQLRQTSHCNQ